MNPDSFTQEGSNRRPTATCAPAQRHARSSTICAPNPLASTHSCIDMGTICACLKRALEFLFGKPSFQSLAYVPAVSEGHFALQHDAKGAWQTYHDTSVTKQMRKVPARRPDTWDLYRYTCVTSHALSSHEPRPCPQQSTGKHTARETLRALAGCATGPLVSQRRHFGEI